MVELMDKAARFCLVGACNRKQSMYCNARCDTQAQSDSSWRGGMVGSCECGSYLKLNLDADELYVMSPDAAWFDGMVTGSQGPESRPFDLLHELSFGRCRSESLETGRSVSLLPQQT